MELKVHFVETNEEISASFDGTQEVLVVDDTSISKYPWSSKNTVDKLCPGFEESGTVVQCEPIEGYPLKVVTEIPETEGVDSLTLTICGKNLFDCETYKFSTGSAIYLQNGKLQNSGSFRGTPDYIYVEHLRGHYISINQVPDGAYTNYGVAFYSDANEGSYISGGRGNTHLVPDNAVYMRFSVPKEYVDGIGVQVEIGDVVTEFEAYRKKEYTAEPTGKSHEWSGVKAMAGINTIWSSVGTTTVEGKSDPVAFIEKLTNAVLSLGGNI